jgi:23S rRNA (guanosine2251-2'-O)-methyltransferase
MSDKEGREAASGALTRINPILEVLRASPGLVNKVFVQQERGPGRLGEVIREARRHGIPVVLVPKSRLDREAPHNQGALAVMAARRFAPLESLLAGPGAPFLVLLDEIEDPQNMGAIIRTAEGAGVDGIVIPEHRSAGLTDAVSTVAAGALEHVKVARVVNLARTMEELKERGVWLVGAEGGAPGPWHAFDYTLPVGIVLGSEGKGLRPLVRKRCDTVLSIPLYGKVTSLNVSAAAAVFLFEAARQRAAASRPPRPLAPAGPR